MKLEPEHESILAGEEGKALSLAMKTMVAYGDAFGAKRLVPIESGHLAGSFGIFIYGAYFKILDMLTAEGVRVKVPTTVNPRPGNDLHLLNRATFSNQKRLEIKLEALGVTPNYSCVCYEGDNAPGLGDVLGWAESSAVQYANSVLGARTNRNSVLIDLCSAVTGVTPEFGYLLDENRRGRIMVKLEVERMDASALGFIVGQKAVDRVPVIEHYDFDRAQLKNMGGAMAAAGGVALFHVEGVTPEAPDLEAVFDSAPEAVITITQQDLDGLRTKDPDSASMVVFGCPQMTFDETMELADNFCGARVKKPTWFCMVPEAKKRFEQTAVCEKVKAAGVLVYDCCPLSALTVRSSKKIVLTPSGKSFYYLHGTEYGTIGDCLLACGAGS